MKKSILFVMASLILSVTPLYSQTGSFLLTVTDSAAISSLDTIGASITANFADPGINGLVHSSPLTSFRPAFAGSKFERLREIYLIEGVDSGYMNTLIIMDSVQFPGYRKLPDVALTADYFPNDWTGSCYTGIDYLERI